MDEGLVIFLLVVFVGVTVGFYALFTKLARMWLGLPDLDLPFPTPMRWVILAGAVHATFIVGWLGSMFV